MIAIRRELNLADIEILYKLYRDESVSNKVDIELPNEFKEETIAVLPSLIQFISTIIRDGNLDKLKSRLDYKSEKDKVANTAKSYLWYVASSLHWLKDFTYKRGESIKSDVKPTNQIINELMRNYKPLGTSFMTTCFDHLSKNAGLVKMFYQPPDYLIVDEDMVEQYINQILKNLGERLNKSMFANLHSLLKPLNTIIYELFKNTDDWATKDRLGNKIQPSVRGVYFRYYKNFQENIKNYTEDNSLLNSYFSHKIFIPDNEKKISFLEISVFDSGDGFVGRRLGKDYNDSVSISEEVSIVKQCLTKYWTNEEGKKGVVKGFGLDRVLSTIDKKGFIRIRTNKICVCRDMISNSYKTEQESENIELYDWTTRSNKEFQSNYNVKGSVITIILPLNALQ